MVRLCRAHTLYTWKRNADVDPLPIERAEGVWMYTADGRSLLDFNSQSMSVNIGHHNPRVVAAMKRQMDQLLYAWPGSATAARARLGKKLADIVPGDIDTFLFTLGGAEANENAIKAVRLATGRRKILARYRSYHGATLGAAQLTGDPRRLPHEPGPPGFIHVMDPHPYRYSFGDDDAERARNNLTYLEEVIQYEGPDQIAAMFIETITGTNGVLPPPADYLRGLRALLDRYGILLVCDEVMAGFGRSGKLFAFEHYGITPDVVTMAKGLTSSYLPLGCMGVRSVIAEHFEDNTYHGGLTYTAHPVCLATAEAVIDVLLEDGLLENATRLEPVMREEMDRLQARHPSVKAGRCIGLFGMVDLQRDADGTPAAPYDGADPIMKAFNKRLTKEGLFTIVRWGSFFCNPPLCITEAELREGFARIDRALEVTDEGFFG